jgi:transcriptional regulator with XRE-family HTH domain
MGSVAMAKPIFETRSEKFRAIFAANLRRRMGEKKINQSELARVIWQENRTDKRGYEQPMGKDRVSAYVNGRVMPTTMNLQKLAEALDTTPEALLADPYENASVTTIDNSPQPDMVLFKANGALITIEVKITVPHAAGQEIMAAITKHLHTLRQE